MIDIGSIFHSVTFKEEVMKEFAYSVIASLVVIALFVSTMYYSLEHPPTFPAYFFAEK